MGVNLDEKFLWKVDFADAVELAYAAGWALEHGIGPTDPNLIEVLQMSPYQTHLLDQMLDYENIMTRSQSVRMWASGVILDAIWQRFQEEKVDLKRGLALVNVSLNKASGSEDLDRG